MFPKNAQEEFPFSILDIFDVPAGALNAACTESNVCYSCPGSEGITSMLLALFSKTCGVFFCSTVHHHATADETLLLSYFRCRHRLDKRGSAPTDDERQHL